MRVKLKLAPGFFQAPLWSNDGQFVFYISVDQDGREAIYRTDAVTSEQLLITSLKRPAFMVLSPADRHIAYLQLQQVGRGPAAGTAHVIDAKGGDPREVLKDWVVAMYWSPDGKQLALLTADPGDEGPTARARGRAALFVHETRFRWWVYDVETEGLELLTSFVPTLEFWQTVPFFDQYHLSLTFWSPDSRYFVITRKNPERPGGTVWVMDTSGQEPPRQVGDGTFAVWSWQ